VICSGTSVRTSASPDPRPARCRSTGARPVWLSLCKTSSKILSVTEMRKGRPMHAAPSSVRRPTRSCQPELIRPVLPRHTMNIDVTALSATSPACGQLFVVTAVTSPLLSASGQCSSLPTSKRRLDPASSFCRQNRATWEADRGIRQIYSMRHATRTATQSLIALKRQLFLLDLPGKSVDPRWTVTRHRSPCGGANS
jgi:hypothetical protein